MPCGLTELGIFVEERHQSIYIKNDENSELLEIGRGEKRHVLIHRGGSTTIRASDLVGLPNGDTGKG